jgi:predicted transcriptional regulator
LEYPPAEGTLVNVPSVTVEGSLSEPTASLFLDGVPVPVAPTGQFAHPVTLQEGLNAFLLVARTTAGGHSELLFTISRDTTPPSLEVLAPAPFAALPDDRALVFGIVERGATVTVAGVRVEVNPFDGTFIARDVLLAPTGIGCLQPTDIKVEAVDRAGNHATVIRPVHADQCVEHPEIAVPLPTLKVAAGQVALYVDLPAYFVDDGGTTELIFTTQPMGAAVGAVTATYATRTLTLGWPDPEFRGEALFSVVARDRTGLSSPPEVLRVLVEDGPAPATPTLIVPDPGTIEALPAGGAVTFTVEARTGAGGPAALEVLSVPRGLAAAARLAAGPEPGTYTVTVSAAPTLASAPRCSFVVLAHGPDGEVASAPVHVSVYDASHDAGIAIESPAPPEVERSVRGPDGSFGAWVEVSAARSIVRLYTEEPVPGRATAEAEALNGERTYFRFFATLPPQHGVAHVRLWVQDPGLPAVLVDLPITVLPTIGPPQIGRLYLTAGGPEPTDARPISMDWQGAVPDPDRTTYTWSADGRVVSNQRQLVGLWLDVGVHTLTLQVDAPQGTTAASMTITVRGAPVPPPPGADPLAVWPWVLLASFAVFGLVMAGTEIGAYFLVVWLVGALIDRQSREKLLAHFVRGRVYQIIQYEPGVHLSELQRKVGVARGVCAYHLHALEKAGLIKASRDGMYLRFTATKVPVDTETYALTEDERVFLHAVEESPGITERELVASLGRSAPAVSRTVKKLSQSGYLEGRREGTEVGWYPRTLHPSRTPSGEP